VNVEVSITIPLPAKIEVNEGFCRILSICSDQACVLAYAGR